MALRCGGAASGADLSPRGLVRCWTQFRLVRSQMLNELPRAGFIEGAYGPRVVDIYREVMAPMLVNLLNGAKPRQATSGRSSLSIVRSDRPSSIWADCTINMRAFEFPTGTVTAVCAHVTLASHLLGQAHHGCHH